MTHKPDLVALVGSRICHDLISPIGAISNGMELIELAGGAKAPELSLIADSVQNANAKIRFFRVAFGQASAEQQVGEQEILTILDNMAIGARTMVDWTVQGAVERAELRLAFLAILCFETALPFGGVISVHRTQGGWQVLGDSEKQRVDDTLWPALVSGDVPQTLAPNQVQFGLLPQWASTLGRSVRTSQNDNRLELTF